MTTRKFEEWSLLRKRKFVSNFVKEYNHAHGTNFEFTEDSLKDIQDYDFSLRQRDGRVLKVQHTFAIADVSADIRYKLASPVIKELEKRLNYLKNLLVYINIHNPPKKREVKKLVHCLDVLIRAKSRNRPSLFTYDERDEHYLKEIKRWVNHLEIGNLTSSKVIFLTGISTFEDYAFLKSGNEMVDKALEHKEKKYSNPEDLVIIIHLVSPLLDHSEFYNLSLPQESKFQEVWVYEGSIGFMRIDLSVREDFYPVSYYC